MTARFPVVEASIAQLRAALEQGVTTSVELVDAYLARIEAYDHGGIRLNAVVELNPDARAEAAASDLRRREGAVLGPLDGIPYTAKDSFMVRGMTVAAGSPAFADLVATRDAFSIERLRAAGCVLIGLTNMPPMANGGMQRGLYGRAESPYNADFLTSAFGSGSSNGSGTATAASFAAFGLGEETWSSGRAPASNNALCAYTPSRGVISVRGNWPLVPTMDVVVPHTRTMGDLYEVLDVLIADDPDTRGDFWRAQPWVVIPPSSAGRPDEMRPSDPLRGRRFGVPAMYLGEDPDAGTGRGIGGPTGDRIEPRPAVLDLWRAALDDLEAAGAEVVTVDFPVVSNYEADRVGAPSIMHRGIVPADFFDLEIWELSMWAWHDFLAANGQPGLSSLAEVDGPQIFPPPEGALPDRYGDFDIDIADYVTRARADGIIDPFDRPAARILRAGLEGLEHTRRVDLEEWMADLGLDGVIFPAVADVGPADTDVSEESAALAWRNGVWVANGNLAIRHLGIPTITVPMGTMKDIGMPVGLTFAGAAYSDRYLLAWAAAFEARARAGRRPLGPRSCRSTLRARGLRRRLTSASVRGNAMAGSGTKDDPWQLKTAPGSSEYTMYRDEGADPPALVCQVGSTRLLYHLSAIDDLAAWLRSQGDWVPLGAADEQKPAADGTVEAWGRDAANPVRGWYGLRKGYRGRFGMYLPPLLEELGLVELTHDARSNSVRAR